MGGVRRRGEKMKVFGAEVARWMRSIAAVGEVADLERARKGWGWWWLAGVQGRWGDGEMLAGVMYLESVQGFGLPHGGWCVVVYGFTGGGGDGGGSSR